MNLLLQIKIHFLLIEMIYFPMGFYQPLAAWSYVLVFLGTFYSQIFKNFLHTKQKISLERVLGPCSHN